LKYRAIETILDRDEYIKTRLRTIKTLQYKLNSMEKQSQQWETLYKTNMDELKHSKLSEEYSNKVLIRKQLVIKILTEDAVATEREKTCQMQSIAEGLKVNRVKLEKALDDAEALGKKKRTDDEEIEKAAPMIDDFLNYVEKQEAKIPFEG